MQLTLTIRDKNGQTLAEKTGENNIALVYVAPYNEGDTLVLTTDKAESFLMLQLDDVLGENFVFQKTNELVYHIPFGEKRVSYNPKAFTGEIHVLTVRIATAAEIAANKNLAKNVYDQHGDPGCYPHAHANVETRGEAVFAARNAIDGNSCNEGHGPWPFESWGINMQDDAEITLEFGRTVAIDRMVLVTRADFPHDNYWQEVTFTFSDGSTLVQPLEKSVAPHEIALAETKHASWIKLSNLKKDSTDPSPFPALSHWEVYGTESK